MIKKIFWGLVILVVGIAIGYLIFGTKNKIKNSENSEKVKVQRVIDGDTIELVDKRIVRYIGIDTPEIDEEDSIKLCLAKMAMEENRRLVENKIIEMKKDISEVDKYGRLLRYVYQDDQFVNQILVEAGFAKILTVVPDVKYNEMFLLKEMEAKNLKKGMWSPEVCQ